MLQFLESGKALYVLAAICLLGMMSRISARNLYKRLMKETDNMTLTKNRFLRDLKQKAENTYRLNQGIKNTQAYLDKQLYGYRFAGVSLSGWANLSGQLTILCFLTGGGAAFASYWYQSDNYYVVLYGAMGIFAGLLTMVVDYGVNLSEKKQQLLTALQDYMENSLFHRLSREIIVPENIGEDEPKEIARSGPRDGIRSINRIERLAKEAEIQVPVSKRNRNRKAEPEEPQQAPQNSRRDIDYLKQSLEQIAVSREKNRTEGDWIKNLTPDELQLVSDILKEYLA